MTPTTRYRRTARWLMPAPIGWLAVAALVLGLDALAVPYYYLGDRAACGGAQCASSTGLTPEQFRTLHEMGLSTAFFAAYDTAVQFAVVAVFAAVAAVIFFKRSADPMALFASFTLLLFGGASFTSDLLQALVHAHPALWLPTGVLNFLGQVSFVVFLYVFPDGRFVPPWTRWFVLAGALLWLPSVFFGMSLTGAVFGPAFFGLLGTMVLAQVYRYRRVSSPEQRRQTRWVVYGVVVALVGFSVAVLIDVFVPLAGHSGLLVRIAAGTLVNAFIVLVPLSIGVAMVRSGLYDVDVLINRTLVYGSLSAMLALIYVGCVVGVQALLRTVTGQEATFAIVVSTLAIAALFNPLRRRVQAFVDRRFYRRKYDARKTLEAFSLKLRDETDLDALSDELVGVAMETIQPAHVSLWLRHETAPRRRLPS